MVGRCGEGQKHAALGQAFVDRDHPLRIHDNPIGRRAEQAAHIGVAGRSGYEHQITDAPLTGRRGLNHAPHGFVAGHQGIGEAGKRRHTAIPEQALSACADAAPEHVHYAFALSGLDQTDRAQGHDPGLFEYDRRRRVTHHPFLTLFLYYASGFFLLFIRVL